MGEYTGRRRGRPASEPQPEEPAYYEYEQGYEQGYGQQPAEYNGYDYGYETPAPSYEPYGYEPQQPPHSRRGEPAAEEMYASEYDYDGYTEQYYDEYTGEYVEQRYVEQPYAEQQYVEQPYAEQPYAEQYVKQSYVEQSYVEQYTEHYAEEYAEPRFEPRRRSAADIPHDYAPRDYASEAPRPHREALPLLAHLPFLGASTAALVITSFVSAKAVAAVVLPLQLLVAWAVLDLTGHVSRRTAAFVALPTLAATLGTFKFQADESATAVAGGLGVGFFLLAADAVFRAGRRGVEPGTVRAIAAGASALLFAGLTGMFLPAARLDTGSVAIGAAVGALVGLVAARNPELGSSRVVVVALPATAAALASYAAAILVA